MADDSNGDAAENLRAAIDAFGKEAAGGEKVFRDFVARAQGELENILSAASKRETDLADAAEHARAELDRYIDKLANDDGGLGDAKQRISELEQELAAKADADQAMQNKIAQLEQAANGATAAAERASTAEARVQELESSLADLQSSSSSSESKIAELTASIAGLEAAKMAAEALAQKSSDELPALREELENRESALGEARKRIEDVEASLARHYEEVESLKGAQTRVEELEAEIGPLRDQAAEAAEARAQLESTRLEVATLNDKISSLQQDLDKEKSSSKAQLAAQLAEALQENAQLQEQLEAGGGSTASAAESSYGSEDAAEPEPAPEPLKPDVGATPSVAGVDKDGRKRQLGELLIEKGIITREHLDTALELQKQSPHTHLGTILIRQGLAPEGQVAEVLAAQAGSNVIDLGGERIAPDVAGQISGKLATLHTCVPIRMTDETLTLAIENPMNLIAIEDVERATGRSVIPVVATRSDIEAAIYQFYASDSAE